MSEMKVFGAPTQQRRARPPSYSLTAGFLAFIGMLNLLAAIALVVCGVYLLMTNKGDADAARIEVQVGGFSIRSEKGAEAAAPARGRQTLAIVCFALAFVPFSIAVLARMQYQMGRQMAWLQPQPAANEQPKE